MNRISTPRTSPRHRLTVWHFAAAILAVIALVFSMLAGTGIARAAGENEENANTSVSTLSEAIPTGNVEGTEADQAKAVDSSDAATDAVTVTPVPDAGTSEATAPTVDKVANTPIHPTR